MTLCQRQTIHHHRVRPALLPGVLLPGVLLPGVLLPGAMLLGAMLLGGCHRPLDVDADPTGTKTLELAAAHGIEGRLTRIGRVSGRVIPEGTRVKVQQAWLLRRNSSSQGRGYRLGGYYDPAEQAEGFVLPEGAIDTYYYCLIDDEVGSMVPVPKEVFKRLP